MQPTYPWLEKYPTGVDWHMALQGRPLGEMFDRAAARFGQQTCIDFLGRKTSYEGIADQVGRAAAGLQALGIGKGDRVGLMMPNCPAFVVAYFAVLKLGGIIVNFNPLYAVEELEYQLRDSRTDILITLDLKILFEKTELLLRHRLLEKVIVQSFTAMLPGWKGALFRLFKGRMLADISRAAGGAVSSFEDLCDNDGRFQPPEAIDPIEDVAVLQYTGGTTGVPKGAMLTHANLSINVEQVRAWVTNLEEGSERIMGFLPLFHVFAMTTVMNFGIASGAEIVLVPRFDLDESLKLIHKVKPTTMPGVPTIYNAMLHHPKIHKFDMQSLKFCISGGAPLPAEVKRGFEAVSGCALVEGYGLSETSPMATANPVTGPVKEGSIGVPVPQTLISIRSLENPDTEVPLGQPGEICIRGPQVMKGYWQDPEASEEAFIGRFFRSGDVGTMDEDGYIFIVDRIKDLILCSGYNVYPRRIEEAIYEHPAVEEVTVVGIPDDYRGEAPKAFIKLRDGEELDKTGLLAFLKPKLSRIEMPEEIEFRDELPKTMIGKLSKKELREE